MKFKVRNKEFLIKFTESSIDLYEIKTVKETTSKNFGKEQENLLGYFNSFDTVYEHIVKNVLASKDSKIKELADLIKEIRLIKSDLKDLLKKEGV